MGVFDFREKLVRDYSAFTRSFTRIHLWRYTGQETDEERQSMVANPPDILRPTS